jgi:hypothetical protein
MRKIGDVGKGPGEYLGALVFIVNEKKETILFADNTSKKFLMYDFTGKCLIERTFKTYPDIALTWIGGMAVNRDGNYILDNEWQPYVKGRCYNLLVMDLELNLISGLHPDRIEAGTFLVSINSGRLQEFDKNLRYWSKSTDTLFSISERYDLLPVCLFKSNDKMVFDDTGTHTISGHVSVSHYLETEKKLIIEGTDNDNRFMLSCNKANGKGTKVFASGKCGLSFGDNVGIENDLFGYSPVYFSDVAAISNGKLILILHPGIIDAIDEWLKGKLTDCLKSAKVLLPDKRDELVRLIENLDENSGPILMAIKLK